MKPQILEESFLISDIESPQEIHIKGARSNNLKNIEVRIPKDMLIVVTGMSGSGKSSLIMDTLYAEGQRRYVESLSSYARQFMMRMKKPDVDYIKGICPAIAIEQRVSTQNPRSTVGTMTEIYDYLRLLFARIGKTYDPETGEEVKKHQVSDVVDFILEQPEETKVVILAPLQNKYLDRTLRHELSLLMQKGFTRIFHEEEIIRIDQFLEEKNPLLDKILADLEPQDYMILVDRIVVKYDDDDLNGRLADSIQTAFYESEGDCWVKIEDTIHPFNNRFELNGEVFLEPTPQLFNYNNSYGACPTCEGYGKVMGIDEEKVIPDPSKSVYEGAVACWSGEKSSRWLDRFIDHVDDDFPIHRPYQDLTEAQRTLLWEGNKHVSGIYDFFHDLEENLYKIQNRVLLARYRGKTTCHTCKGGRLRKEALYILVAGKNIHHLVQMPIDQLLAFFKTHTWFDRELKIAKRILFEIQSRLQIMDQIGLGYLTLDRLAASLSGGETQRIHLTRTLGSNLTNSLYILDEPSIGLHPKDTEKLVDVLKSLRDLGNTVVVVEHEEEVIRSADYILDIGPEAGIHGGEIVFAGPYPQFLQEASQSLTAQYLTGKMEIALPERRRLSSDKISIIGARHHNLKNIDVTIPLHSLTVVSGVSGSGKTTLIKHILHPALVRQFGEPVPANPGRHGSIDGDLQVIHQVELINQNPIGKSSRSNPITYVKAYDSIRNLMSRQPLSKMRGFKPGHFSFNTDGGRCDTCKGEGEIVVEMQFLADVRLTCEDCKGQRFKQEVLDVEYKGKNIYQILDLSIEEALDFFSVQKDIVQKIKPLADVGLGYVKLGQSSSTLSGGEAQRVKLASYLNKDHSNQSILFIFDEPTTGLHFHDINKLLYALNALVENGHTVLVVEHNLEVIKSADWLIDLGPGGGIDGGHLVYQGPPEGILNVKTSHTARFLREKLLS